MIDRNRPRDVPQVMVSSTFTDLKVHRQALMAALSQHKLHPNGMEQDGAKVDDVITSSLTMVRESAAYIGLISHKYGQTPACPSRNPNGLSITELEFNEAQSLGRPILLYIMGEDHAVRPADIETDPDKRTKLEAFRDRAKKVLPGASVERVYAVFNDIQEFKDKLGASLAGLSLHLAEGKMILVETDLSDNSREVSKRIPPPPEFYAAPYYAGSHKFVGRTAELQALSDWAAPADPTNLLLYWAIGGNGKSMLSWEWTKNHAVAARPPESPWAGRFWYSFYERGGLMRDFCHHALAYMTGQSLKHYAKKRTAELKDELLALLHEKPWLIILDGLERVLVAYHRIDASEIRDEDVSVPSDKIANRNPCDAIREEDNDLLRALAAASPSKLLVCSRLTPRVLLNPSGQPIPGTKCIGLSGLRPQDAEDLLRSCEIEGNSKAIQHYLTKNCDNHPLVIGALGGLIANFLPDRGNFDAWSTAAEGGAQLSLSSLDLVQRRNHILHAAIEALPHDSRALLSTLALLSDSVDYETLAAFNPHLPPEPDVVDKPDRPEGQKQYVDGEFREWDRLSDEEKAKRHEEYKIAVSRWQSFEKQLEIRLESEQFRNAPKNLERTVNDLERRGLLQWDRGNRHYDLHPVVRGVASGSMGTAEREHEGQRLVDYFTAQPHRPYDEAETMDDLRSGLHVLRTLFKLDRLEQASQVCLEGLLSALHYNLEAHIDILALLRPFFPSRWSETPQLDSNARASFLLNEAAMSLDNCGEYDSALSAYVEALRIDIALERWVGVQALLLNISFNLSDRNRPCQSLRMVRYALEVATIEDNQQGLFVARLYLYRSSSLMGLWTQSDRAWNLLDSMGRDWWRGAYRKGNAECEYAFSQYFRGTLQEEHLALADKLALEGKNRRVVRRIQGLRGRWRLEQCNWELAVRSLNEALRMARERGLQDQESETGLALAKHHMGQLPNPQEEAERLSQLRAPAHRFLAMLWLALGEREKAKEQALAAYRWAWADGEPYVRRYELTKTTELLHDMGLPIPNLPPYDPAKDEPFPWESEVRAAIDQLKAEKEAESKTSESEEEI